MSLFTDRGIQVDFKLAIVFNSSGVSFQQLYKVQDSSLGYDAEFITNQDPCILNPCQNGGTCNIGNGTSPYFCNCTSSFTGFLYLKFIEKTFIIF